MRLTNVAHEGARRVQMVTAAVTGRDVSAFTGSVETALKSIQLPHAVYYELAGADAARRVAQREGPLAIVVLGGLVTSTALSLFVLPTLAVRFGQFGEVRNE